MRALVTYSFVFLYMIAMLRPVQPMVEYFLNQGYIKEVLCINKNKPQLQCNGKCYLTKQLKKQQETPANKVLEIAMEKYPIGFVELLKLQENTTEIALSEKQSFFYNNTYRSTYLTAIFHPPNFG